MFKKHFVYQIFILFLFYFDAADQYCVQQTSDWGCTDIWKDKPYCLGSLTEYYLMVIGKCLSYAEAQAHCKKLKMRMVVNYDLKLEPWYARKSCVSYSEYFWAGPVRYGGQWQFADRRTLITDLSFFLDGFITLAGMDCAYYRTNENGYFIKWGATSCGNKAKFSCETPMPECKDRDIEFQIFHNNSNSEVGATMDIHQGDVAICILKPLSHYETFFDTMKLISEFTITQSCSGSMYFSVTCTESKCEMPLKYIWNGKCKVACGGSVKLKPLAEPFREAMIFKEKVVDLVFVYKNNTNPVPFVIGIYAFFFFKIFFCLLILYIKWRIYYRDVNEQLAETTTLYADE